MWPRRQPLDRFDVAMSTECSGVQRVRSRQWSPSRPAPSIAGVRPSRCRSSPRSRRTPRSTSPRRATGCWSTARWRGPTTSGSPIPTASTWPSPSTRRRVAALGTCSWATALTGRAPVPPDYLFRHWRGRDEFPFGEPVEYDGVLLNPAVADELRHYDELGLPPPGVFHLDRPWGTGPEGYDLTGHQIRSRADGSPVHRRRGAVPR